MSTKVELAEEIFDRASAPVAGALQLGVERYFSILNLQQLHVLSAQEYASLADVFSCSTFETGSLGNLQMRAGLQRVFLRVELVDAQGNRFELDLLRLHAVMADEPYRAHLQIRNGAARQIRSRFSDPLFTAWSIDAFGIINVQTDPVIDFHKEPVLQVLLTLEVIMKQVAKAFLLREVHFQLGAPPNLSGFCAFRGARVPVSVLHAFLAHDHARSVDLHDAPRFWCASTVDQELRMERVLREGHPARKIFEAPAEALCTPRVALQSSASIFFRLSEIDNVARLRAVTLRLNQAMHLARVADYAMAGLIRSMRRVLLDGGRVPADQAALEEAFREAYAKHEPLLRSEFHTPLEYRVEVPDDAVIGTQLWVLRALRAATESTCTGPRVDHSHDLSDRTAKEATREAQRKAGVVSAVHLCQPARPLCIGQLVQWDLGNAEAEEATSARAWRFNGVAWAHALARASPVACAQVGCDPACPEPVHLFNLAHETRPEKAKE